MTWGFQTRIAAICMVLIGAGTLGLWSLVLLLCYEAHTGEHGGWQSAYLLLSLATPAAVWAAAQFVWITREFLRERREQLVEEVMRS